jgi:hydrogenase maturation protein HypF
VTSSSDSFTSPEVSLDLAIPCLADSVRDAPTLAVGGQQKATFAWSEGTTAHVSRVWGDLEDAPAFDSYSAAIGLLEARMGSSFVRIAHDLHPDYLSTRFAIERARERGSELIGVQHHHAHLSACLAEHGVTTPVLGVVFDGTGYGADGNIWGGEFLVGDMASVERGAHLRSVPMPGGARAIREPWRMALAFLVDSGLDPAVILRRIPEGALRVARGMIAARVNAPLTSSCGRLFDAVAALMGLCDQAEFEGQGPIELEKLAVTASGADAYECTPHRTLPKAFCGVTGAGGVTDVASVTSAARVSNAAGVTDVAGEIDTRPLIRAVVADLERGRDRAEIAAAFHCSVAELIIRSCAALRVMNSLETVALSGGVFHNRPLLEAARKGLEENGFRVLTHQRTSPGDASLSLGQLVVAAAKCR